MLMHAAPTPTTCLSIHGYPHTWYLLHVVIGMHKRRYGTQAASLALISMPKTFGTDVTCSCVLHTRREGLQDGMPCRCQR